MEHFVAYKLNFTCEALTTVSLPHYNGSTLRGAFFSALRRDFCLNKKLPDSTGCLHCPAAEVCPICRLVATVEYDSNRGAEIPRPFALEPVIAEETLFEAGQLFSFGITLFGQSLFLFPYVILAIQHMGEIGIGNRTTRTKESGRFLLREATVTNPLTAAVKSIYTNNTRIVNVPDIAITHRDVSCYAAGLNSDRLLLNLLTPLRLIVDGSLVRKLTFRTFAQRLLRRLTDLYHYYCNQELNLDFPLLLKQAEEVQVTQDNTRWIDLSSYSSRRHATTPTGGLIGEITFEGNLKHFLPLLVWGEITHIGKDTTRGNGWYRIADSSS